MFIAELGASLNCTTSCGNRGVDIRFPFWIKDRQPDQCGYPGFAISCNERGDIVLELPPAGKLHIEKIDYKNHVIHASDPQRCLLRQHSNFNSSVFNLQFEMSKVNFTIFNCSLNNTRPPNWMAPCLSTVHYDVLAVDSELSIEGKESLLSCTKIAAYGGLPTVGLPNTCDKRQVIVKKTCLSSRAGRATCALDPSTLFEVFLRAGFLILTEGYCRLLLYE
ncbi:hypothetical protein DKX38_011815 [Salix brachista]|uniref:RING-type E3 ubiquitin transferase n=1 Tax=Salix brachista TaxID=2182728 RepID=A0A5N5M000_9ROSI|nr:hypothetical protein DKX38_011815 [Salix brachista]